MFKLKQRKPKKRCVFNKAEVVVQEQPQQKIEIKINNKNKVVEEEEKPKQANKVITANVKREETIEKPNLQEPKKNGKTPRKGYNLYTISANIKIGDERFTIQRIVEEKTEKLANIEYDRMIKKEFGKPKSVTKRTLKEYQEEDIDSCVKVIEEAPKKVEDSPETIELNRKIEILDSKYIGIYKVTFAKNNIFVHNNQYIYASDIDDAYDQIKYIADKDDLDVDYVVGKIKSVMRMTGNAIKMDKACLKRIGEDTVEELEKMLEACMADEKETYDNAIKKFKELTEKGFSLYVGKLMPKGQIHFAEIARNEDEVNALILAEDRTHKALLSGQKIEGASVGSVEEINQKSEEYKDVDPIENADVYVNAIKGLAQKNDIVYRFLFSDQSIETYSEFLDENTTIVQSLKKGNGKEYLLSKLDELSDQLQEKMSKQQQLRDILKGNHTRVSTRDNEGFLHSLFKK